MTNPTFSFRRYYWIVFLAFLTACGTTPPAPTVSPTFTPFVETLTALPTFAPTATVVAILPTPLPTQLPIIMLTPDAIQVEMWKEYQTALAKGILPMDSFESVLCEWDILARSGQEVYVWAVCASPMGDDMRPAVIHLGAGGSVRSVEIPKRGSLSDFNKLFPEVARVKMNWYVNDMDNSGDGMIRELYSHIEYRRTHPAEPPLVVLLATPIPTPTP